LAPWWVWALIALAIALALVGFVWIIRWGPGLLVQQGKATDDAYLKAITDTRTALVQAVGGFAVFIGVIVGVFTLRHNRQQLLQAHAEHDASLAANRKEHEESLQASRDALQQTLEFNRESLTRTARLTERGLDTERFSKAIGQLGESAENSVDLRLGGIYALEQLSRDSPDAWYQPVLEVLAAFVRQHSNGLSLRQGDAQSQLAEVRALPVNDWRTPLKVDVETAIAVIGRRDRKKDEYRLDFHGANFCRIQFPVNARLRHVNFGHARMQLSRMFAADLRESLFVATELQGADLQDADLRGADFYATNFYQTDFKDAKFEGTVLESVDLTDALNLTVDQLRVAKIRGRVKLPGNISPEDIAKPAGSLPAEA
jgi:uncharacterized protein YjbI with pentapeptide repeats